MMWLFEPFIWLWKTFVRLVVAGLFLYCLWAVLR